MSGLSFNLFGPFEVTFNGDRQLHFPTTKTQALLAYLLVEETHRPGVSHQRGNLMMLLWPDLLPESAQANLRQTLYRLRQTLPEVEVTPDHMEPLLLSDRQSVQVNSAVSYHLDVAVFERALRDAERGPQRKQMAILSEAVVFYRGDFLADVYVPDSETFENWAGQVRADLRRRALDALHQIGEHALVLGDYHLAQDTARRQIAIDDLHEAAYRQLMLALSAAGERNEALTEFTRLTQLLADELGVEPAKETARLAEAVRQGGIPLRLEPTPDRRAVSETVPIERQIEPVFPDRIADDDSATFRYLATITESGELEADKLVLQPADHFGQALERDSLRDQQPKEPPSNLPYELNRFVGRQEQIAAISDLFERENTRLVTLTGPGGVGKTRLATKVASLLRPRFLDGVWLVELARLTNPVLIAQLTVHTFDLVEEDKQTRMQTLIEFLRSRNLLLVLDNCEHLIEDVAQFTQSLLRAAPGLSVLATSREPLGVEGETVWALPPLSSPDPEEEVTLETLGRYEATDLFIERASAVQSSFGINHQNALAVAQICARLDGIPLAIELAAARLRALSVEDIVARLDDRFRLLVGSRTSEPRQQTLQALIDWSYDLLPERERKLMRRLSVFVGGWSLTAVEAVCSGNGIEEAEVLDLLAQLVDKSLVVTELQKGVIRYQFLETIRRYAADRLEKAGEVDEYRTKHAQYYLRLAQESYGKCWGREQGVWLDRLETEHDNLRKAMEYLLNEDPTGDALLRMAGSLWRYWEVRGYINMGRYWLALALKDNPTASTYVRANGLRGAGILARQQGDYVEAKARHEESLRLFQQLGPDYNLQVARQHDALGEIEQYYGNYELAIALHEQSLALQQEIGDKEGVAASLAHLGVIARERGRYDEAEKLLQQSLELNRELGDRLRISVDLNNLGLVATRQCLYERALSYHEEAVEQYRDLNNKLGISESLLNMGDVAKNRGDFKHSMALHNECLVLKKELGDRRGIARTSVRLATTALLQGDYRRAQELAEQSLVSFKDLGIRRGIVVALRIRALVAVYEGDFEFAGRLAEESLQLAQEIEALIEAALAKNVLGLSAHAQARLAEAREWFEEALLLFREVNDRRNIAHTLVGLARTAYRLDDHQRAHELLEESLSLSRTYGIQWSLAFSLEIMGLLRRSEGDYVGAVKMFWESLQLSFEQESRQGIVNCLGAIAGLAAMLKQPEIAARLFAFTEQLRAEIGNKMGQADQVEYEAYIQLARSQLGEDNFNALWRDGQAMSTQQAVREALNEIRV
ncbi:MAG TPA: tetratricopeptide repeat protein [Anaerolineae bacterium]|jgi:non-specific serine/threonine protein kinase|nr:tetratricopeptide repeat protein [Anaerolineae bacterium]